MKKMTSVIAIVVLFAMLFTGCEFIPTKRDFSHYGFTFTIAGKVVEREGNKYGDAQFQTVIGTIGFIKQDIPSNSDINNAHQLAQEMAEYFKEDFKTDPSSVRVLGNGASYFVGGPIAQENGTKTMAFVYSLQYGQECWVIVCEALAEDFDQAAIIEFCMSAEFC